MLIIRGAVPTGGPRESCAYPEFMTTAHGHNTIMSLLRRAAASDSASMNDERPTANDIADGDEFRPAVCELRPALLLRYYQVR